MEKRKPMTRFMPYAEFKKCQEGIIQLSISLDPQYLVTMRFNSARPVPIFWAQRQLRYFDAELDSKLLGYSWAKRPNKERTRFIAIPEGRSTDGRTFSDLHYHLLLTPPPQPRIPIDTTVLATLATNIWNKYAHCDDVDVRSIYDVGGAASYVAKTIPDPGAIGLCWFDVTPMSLGRHPAQHCSPSPESPVDLKAVDIATGSTMPGATVSQRSADSVRPVQALQGER